tara:strand:+ start:5163 stop:5543 length:381 start_codon:yes stop_codon:yes gene_type:complete
MSRVTVYPHRRKLLATQICDACSNAACDFTEVPGCSHVGLWCCLNKNCKETIKAWLDETTISNEKLKAELGDNVYVYRSDGTKESSWFIVGSAHREYPDEPFWITVKNKHRHSKCIKLDVLKEWNN